MLNHNKHVLCEKPLTLHLKDTRELFELAKKKQRFLMEVRIRPGFRASCPTWTWYFGQYYKIIVRFVKVIWILFLQAVWTRCFPAYQQLRQEIVNKTIGDPTLVIASVGVNFPEAPGLLCQRDLGGGVLVNVSCYALQLASLVFQNRKPVAVKACSTLNTDGNEKPANCHSCHTKLKYSYCLLLLVKFRELILHARASYLGVRCLGVDETTAIILQYDDGAMASFLVSICTDLDSSARIIGSEGNIEVSFNLMRISDWILILN